MLMDRVAHRVMLHHIQAVQAGQAVVELETLLVVLEIPHQLHHLKEIMVDKVVIFQEIHLRQAVAVVLEVMAVMLVQHLQAEMVARELQTVLLAHQ